MKINKALWGILLLLGLVITSSCAQSAKQPLSPFQIDETPTETPLPGGAPEQAPPQPPGGNIQGSVDFIFIYAIYHPGDMDYSASINIPFHVNRDDPPYTEIIGSDGSAVVSATEEAEDCPVNIEETFNIKDLGGSLITDDQGNQLLDFTYLTNNSGEYYMSCDEITLPLGGSEWSENEVTLPAVDGYEYIPSPDSPVRFVLHIDPQL